MQCISNILTRGTVQMQALAMQQAQEEADLVAKSQAAAASRGPSASAPGSPPSRTPSSSGSSGSREYAPGPNAPAANPPHRSQSGVELGSFNGRGGSTTAGRLARSRFAALGGGIGGGGSLGMSSITQRDAQSMPGSRRHSRELDPSAVTDAFHNLSVECVLKKRTTCHGDADVPWCSSKAGSANNSGDAPLLTNFLFDDELEAELQSAQPMMSVKSARLMDIVRRSELRWQVLADEHG